MSNHFKFQVKVVLVSTYFYIQYMKPQKAETALKFSCLQFLGTKLDVPESNVRLQVRVIWDELESPWSSLTFEGPWPWACLSEPVPEENSLVGQQDRSQWTMQPGAQHTFPVPVTTWHHSHVGRFPTPPEQTHLLLLCCFKKKKLKKWKPLSLPQILLFFLQVKKAYLAAKAVFQPLFDAFPSD